MLRHLECSKVVEYVLEGRTQKVVESQLVVVGI